MRARRSGTVVNMSSRAGQDGLATCGIYSGTKFALEGLSEALAREEADFGISVLIVEPGGFRTNFMGAFVANERGIGRDGPGGLLARTMEGWSASHGKQPGDPVRGVDAIFQVVAGEGEAGGLKGKVLRLPLGRVCVEGIEAKLERVRKDVDATRDVAYGTDA